MGYNKIMLSAKIEQEFEWNKWRQEIPKLNFKNKWDVKIIPPFGGAVIRFLVEYKNKHVSVYLDCYDNLGLYGEPYWEIYPYDDDIYRCPMNDTKTLLKKIDEVLKGKDS